VHCAPSGHRTASLVIGAWPGRRWPGSASSKSSPGAASPTCVKAAHAACGSPLRSPCPARLSPMSGPSMHRKHRWRRVGPRRLEYHGSHWWITFWKRKEWRTPRPRCNDLGFMRIFFVYLPRREITLRRWRHARPQIR